LIDLPRRQHDEKDIDRTRDKPVTCGVNDPMGRHQGPKAPANDPVMTVVVTALLLLLVLVFMLSGV
jgi:hypothetical protein